MAHKSQGGKCVVVTSRHPILKQWKEEYAAQYPEADVQFYIINTAYKKPIECDLLIVDEAHRAFSPAFKELFTSVKYNSLLCLTATLPSDEAKVRMLREIAPVVYERTVDQAGQSVSPYTIVNLGVKLDRSTLSKYGVFNRMFTEAQIALSRLWYAYYRDEFASIFDLARYFATKSGEDEVIKLSKRYWSGMSLRKKTLYEAPTKLEVARQIVKANPQRKWILFTKTIKFAKELADLTGALLYHSKLNEKEKQAVLTAFSTTRRPLVAVDALNEGLNVPDADAAICVSGVSTQLTNIQQLGRIIRSKEGKTALFINLYVPDSQEEKWVRAKTSKLQNVRYEQSIAAISTI